VTKWPDGLAFSVELARQSTHGSRIAGIDEAGRGPWAGPVVAAAVVLDPSDIPKGLNDSKLLRPEARERLALELADCAEVGIGIASVERIDRDNILVATLWAMAEACAALRLPPDLALVDGNRAPPLCCPVETIVDGDAQVVSIAAASIIAKVKRDAIMRDLGLAYPAYGFAQHKGYGTAAHRAALTAHGPCPVHRRSFKPIRAFFAMQEPE
jgi:ribonuclease HII